MLLGYPVYSIVKEPAGFPGGVPGPPAVARQRQGAGPQLRAEQVENTGLEPVTSGLQSRRSPN